MEEKSKGVTKKIIAAGVAAATCAVFATACTAPWSKEQDQKTDAMAKTKIRISESVQKRKIQNGL